GDDRTDALQVRPLRGPVAARPGAELLAGQHDQRRSLFAGTQRRVVDRHDLAARQVPREAALDALREAVADPDVRERASHHHLEVTAPRAVLMEVAELGAARHEVLARRRDELDAARRRDVIGRDAVAEERDYPWAAGVVDLPGRRARHAVDLRGPAHVR